MKSAIQEYPNKPLKDALLDKLKYDNNDKTFAVGF